MKAIPLNPAAKSGNTPWFQRPCYDPDSPYYSPEIEKTIFLGYIRAENPSRLSKRFYKDPGTGDIGKDPGGQLVTGQAVRWDVDNVAELAERIESLGPNEALTYGVPLWEGSIVTQKVLQAGEATGKTQGLLARDRRHYCYSPVGLGVLAFDYDPPEGEKPFAREAWMRILHEVLPGLKDAPQIWLPSASSCIIDTETGEQVRGSCGQRLLVICDKPSRIPEAGGAAHWLMWATGHGRIQVSASGALLTRTLFDLAMFSPERLDFVGGAEVIPPLKQDREKPLIFNEGGAPLKLDALIRAGGKAEAKAKQVIEQAKRAVKPQAEKQRAIFLASRPAQLRQAYQRAFENGCLVGDFELIASDGERVAVAELLKDRERWHGTRFRDPLEPEYRGDGRIAVAYLDKTPVLYSHAHGGTNYRLYASEDDIPITPDRVLRELNRRHALVPVGGDMVILNEETDPLSGAPTVSFSNQAGFKLRYSNQRVTDGGRTFDWGTYWLQHPQRRQYEGLVFAPGESPTGYFNLFRGFGIEAKKGQYELFKAHMREVICTGNEDFFRYVFRWAAHLFQKPAELPGVALVLRSGEGTGKNWFVGTLGKLVGQAHYVQLNSMGQLTGRFNGHLRDALLVFANEATWGGDKTAEGTLKAMITDADSTVEMKGRDAFSLRNYKRVIVASNEDWAVPMGRDARRFFCLDVSEARKGDLEYFGKLKEELETGGYEALLHELLAEDLSDFNPFDMPANDNGADMKLLSAGSVAKWWHEQLVDEAAPPPGIEAGHSYYGLLLDGTARCSKESIYGAYQRWCKNKGERYPREQNAFFRDMKKMLRLHEERPLDRGRRIRCVILPRLEEAREMFEQFFNVRKFDWD